MRRIKETKSVAARTLRVFFFGDSICFGQGVSPHRVWVGRLSAALERQFARTVDLQFQNPSINGNTTRQALERIAYDIQSHSPHIVLVQFGMNDCNVWETDRGHPRVSPDAFRANLSEIIDRARIFGAKQVILGTNHPTTRTEKLLPGVDYTYEAANRSYNAITREVAAAKSATLADAEHACDAAVNAGEVTYESLVLDDQLHLSATGHDIYFRSRLPVLVSALASVAATL